jgi:hypothetical protein
MVFSSRRITGQAFLLLPLLLVAAGAGVARAQTVASNPTTLAFPPSPDHARLLADGRPAVDHYDFDVYSVGASQPFQRTTLGKPAPASDGSIYYDFSGAVMSWPLPGGTYEARVAAVGPYGSGVSNASNPFTFTSVSCSYALSGTAASLPAAGGGTQVSVTTGAACRWTAASNATWVVLSTAGGTGNGTVVATVAANTSTSARTATLTVAGRTFTVSQAGVTVAGQPPSAPASPAPTAGATSVSTTPTLTWTCAGTTSYTVRLGTSTPPAQLATGVSATSYAPGTLAAGTKYYWQVVAVNASGSTPGSIWSFTTATVTAPPSSALPSPWLHRDIGTVGGAGTAAYASGLFTVTGTGADIWGTADGFHFLYRPLTGLSQIVARLTGQQTAVSMAKAGIMMREGRDGLVAGAGHAMLSVRPNGTVEFVTRSATGATTTLVATTTQAAPAWLKLVRTSTTVTASVSANGTTWRTVGSASLGLTSKALVGLAVTGHDQTQPNTATFDSVTVK